MMKLRYNPTSPYVRKCVVMIEEVGLADRVERVMTHPWAEFTDAHTVNPLGKVPTLIREDGSALYDSAVICEYLDTVHDGPKMFPASGDIRWTALRRQILGDGIVDAGGDALREKRRVEHERSPGWIVRQMNTVDRCLDELELEASTFDGMNIGLIAIGSGLGFLDFRHPDHDWRATRPNLTAWFAETSLRPSFKSTEPWEWVPEDGGRMNTWTGWPRDAAT
jgi:glutathione S-transferase